VFVFVVLASKSRHKSPTSRF